MSRFIPLVLFAFCVLGFATAQRCDSVPSSAGWRPIASASRDGTVIEIANTYGVAVTYGLFKFVKGSVIQWQSATDPNSGVGEDCLLWRPYKGKIASYTDPTGGQQNSIKYWCDAIHARYDPKKDRCIP